MTAPEFATISMAIKAAYPNANLMPDKQSKEVWYTMLSDMDYTVCMAAIKEIISNNKFAPSIAEIRAKYTSLISKPILDYGEAWETVLMAIRRFGYMEEMSALDSLDDITRKCVKRLGFQNICASENIVADRANFRDIYNQEAQRVRENSQLPPMLRDQKQQLIGQIIKDTAGKITMHEEPVKEVKTADMDQVSQRLKELRR